MSAGVAMDRVRPRVSNSGRQGFTLVELLAVVAIIGTLVGLTLPAIQSARESARRSQCGSNLRQMGIAIASYESARRTFPLGNEAHNGRHHAWSSFVLPYLEESVTASRINYALPWNHPTNVELADTMISIYLCPSRIQSYAGKQDYGGVLGTSVVLSETETRPHGWEHGGILYATDAQGPRAPCHAGQVSDGLSRTLLVSEGVDRGFADMETFTRIGNAFWACGTNCFLHNSPVLNTPDVDGFRSNHLGGVHGLYGDGHVSFMLDRADPRILIAACTKAGGEGVSERP
jgi:prepilin-type N-terminal cleavage/methylation domain-containing protein